MAGAISSLNHPDLKSFLDDLASQLPTDNETNSMERLLPLPLDRIAEYPSVLKVREIACLQVLIAPPL